jgi:hypothetical protein
MIGADIRVRPASALPQVAARRAAVVPHAAGFRAGVARGAWMDGIAGIDSHDCGIHPLTRLHAHAFLLPREPRPGARPHAPRVPA